MIKADWDQRYIDLAKFISQWSKDPSTKTGAVLVRDNRIVSVGYNGFAEGVQDTQERLNDRPTKYKYTVHCEKNAVLTAAKQGNSTNKTTLYTWPFQSCLDCTSHMIQAGVIRHVAPKVPDELLERWGEDMAEATALFYSVGIEVVLL